MYYISYLQDYATMGSKWNVRNHIFISFLYHFVDVALSLRKKNLYKIQEMVVNDTSTKWNKSVV